MKERFTLFRTVYGISKCDQQIAFIPAGVLIELMVGPTRVGVAEAVWEGQSITVLFQDVESNGRLIGHDG